MKRETWYIKSSTFAKLASGSLTQILAKSSTAPDLRRLFWRLPANPPLESL